MLDDKIDPARNNYPAKPKDIFPRWRERKTDRQTETETDRDRQTETERQRQTETDRQRERELNDRVAEGGKERRSEKHTSNKKGDKKTE